jgi:hypothetical protein
MFKLMIKVTFCIVLSAFIAVIIGIQYGISTIDDSYGNEMLYHFVDINENIHLINTPDVKEKKSISHYSLSDRKSSIRIPDSYRQIIFSKSDRYRIEPLLISAVIKVESNWDPRAVSRKGAMGLMQLMPSTAKEMEVDNPFNPEENIEGGLKYLRYLLNKFNGDLNLALAAYNAGPNRIQKYGGIPPITETQRYVKRILSLYNDMNSTNRDLISKNKELQKDIFSFHSNYPFWSEKSVLLNF